jgi:hypothetical protein
MNTTLTAERVHDYTEMLCEALKHDYVEMGIKRCEFFRAGDPDGIYYKKRIQELKDGINCYDYIIEKGRKYLKVIMVTEDGGKSAHAFVDRNTGDVYMSASWKAPARNGARYNLLCEGDLNWLLENADWAGSYLYKKG